jgi:hypothetical protein
VHEKGLDEDHATIAEGHEFRDEPLSLDSAERGVNAVAGPNEKPIPKLEGRLVELSSIRRSQRARGRGQALKAVGLQE